VGYSVAVRKNLSIRRNLRVSHLQEMAIGRTFISSNPVFRRVMKCLDEVGEGSIEGGEVRHRLEQ
jgi:hypothetical protein